MPTDTTTEIPSLTLLPSLTREQTTGIQDLIRTGRSFGLEDAKNFAYASGVNDYNQFVGLTGNDAVALAGKLKTSPVSTLSNKDGITAVNDYEKRLNTILSNRVGSKGQVLVTDPKTGRQELRLGEDQIKDTVGSDTKSDVATGESSTDTFTLKELLAILEETDAPNDLSGFTRNADGTFSPTNEGLRRLGLTGLGDQPVNPLQDDINDIDTQIEGLLNDLKTYNVDNDPDYQEFAAEIRDRYRMMREEMVKTNYSRQRAFETLGYRTGSTQFAGAIQGGIVGEEIKQGNERIAEINRQEKAALLAAKRAFETENYDKFAKEMDALDKIRGNKADALASYNKSLADAYTRMKDANQFELDVLKYQLDLKKSGETELTKNYDYAVGQGFEGSIMDYMAIKNELEQNYPSSYVEWNLAGGLEGTGKTYGQFIAESEPKGPTSYQEWNLAGGLEGTGKTYAEWVGRQNGLPSSVVTQIDKISASFDSSPIVKQFNEVLNKKISVDQMVGLDASGPIDLALVFEFMKALDPTSVVKEKEYENAAKTGTIFKSWAAKFNGQFKDGQFLPADVRKEFQKLIDIKFDAIEQQYEQLRSEKARLINQKTGENDGDSYLVEYRIGQDGKTFDGSYATVDALLKEKPQYVNFILAITNELTREGIEASDENVLQLLESRGLLKGQKVSFNNVAPDTQTGTGMRTDRHNNPTAFTVDIARQAGLREGVDFIEGDPFPNNPNQKTATLLNNPVDTTIKVIDKIGFYTGSGQQRWSHTAIPQAQWKKMSYEQKKKVVRQMYNKEGNRGELNSMFG